MKRTEFDWQDPLHLEHLLEDDDRMIRDSARDFAQNELLPGIIEANRHEKFDPTIMKKMGGMGLLGPTLEGYGIIGSDPQGIWLFRRIADCLWLNCQRNGGR